MRVDDVVKTDERDVSIAVGDMIKVDKCDACPAVIGKTAKVTGLTSKPGYDAVTLSFGRGRPQAGRPHVFGVLDISLVCEKEKV